MINIVLLFEDIVFYSYKLSECVIYPIWLQTSLVILHCDCRNWIIWDNRSREGDLGLILKVIKMSGVVLLRRALFQQCSDNKISKLRVFSKWCYENRMDSSPLWLSELKESLSYSYYYSKIEVFYSTLF